MNFGVGVASLRAAWAFFLFFSFLFQSMSGVETINLFSQNLYLLVWDGLFSKSLLVTGTLE